MGRPLGGGAVIAGPGAYGTLERLLHRLAFARPGLQLTAAGLERALYGRSFKALPVDRPIFVCGLPRAGTTLVLELLARHPDLACQSYRDMPFVLAPLLWPRFSRAFRRPSQLVERAHADGVTVGFDSPEAFEEVVWKLFWPTHYRDQRIRLWRAADADPDALDCLRELMRKVIVRRGAVPSGTARYLSKNNANLARIELLSAAFPAATLLVPLRRPMEQARSLLRQHRRFDALHRSQPFALRYMSDLGHHEFGLAHRPFDFSRAAAMLDGRDPATLDYWLAYWIAAYDEAWRQRASLRLLSFDALRSDGEAGLTQIAAELGLAPEPLCAAAGLLRPVGTPEEDDATADRYLLAEALELHERLLSVALPTGERASIAQRRASSAWK